MTDNGQQVMAKPHIAFGKVSLIIKRDFKHFYHMVRVMVMVFKATFNNILVILWFSDLLLEEIGTSREHRRLAASH